jgi:alpha-1,6-mannosyltransferase
VKSLHLTNSWHANSGGIATFYRSLMEAANRRGHSMVLVIPGEKDEEEDVGACGRIYRVLSSPAPTNRDYRLIRPFSYLWRGTRLRQILKTESPDLVEVCDKYTLNYFGGMLRAGMMGDVDCHPVVVGLSCERMDDNVRAYLGWNPFAPGLVRFYMKWLYFSLFDHHIANSHYTAEELRPASCGHPIRRGVWIRPMGVDCRGLSPSHRSPAFRRALCKRASASEKSALLLYVGRLVPEKNLRLLTETLSQLHAQSQRDWRLIVVGDGIGRDEFLAESECRAPARVVWLGHLRNRSELAGIYANSDVFVHPNPREPFGIAPLEAMASGLPLIAPDRGGVLSYANSSNAWIVPPVPEAFSQAIREAMSDDHVRQCRIVNALRTAEQFRWENVANAFLDLYEDMVRPKEVSDSSGEEGTRFQPDFASTPPDCGPSTLARITASVFQRLLAPR